MLKSNSNNSMPAAIPSSSWPRLARRNPKSASSDLTNVPLFLTLICILRLRLRSARLTASAWHTGCPEPPVRFCETPPLSKFQNMIRASFFFLVNPSFFWRRLFCATGNDGRRASAPAYQAVSQAINFTHWSLTNGYSFIVSVFLRESYPVPLRQR